MARDWVDILPLIEGPYPRAAGGTSKDEALRLELVGWANNLFKEIERTRRWPMAYGTATIVTTAGVQTYPIPAGILYISNLYWMDTSGTPVPIENYSAMQMRRAFGEGAQSQPGAPTKCSVLGNNLEIFPVPDNAGPTGGNYTLIVEGYQTLTPIVETSGTTVGGSPTLTVPSTAGLVAAGVPTTGTTGLSVRRAGNQIVANTAGSVVDTLITNWSAFPLATTVTMTSNAVTVVASGQVFFNSQNWLLTDFPKVVQFGVCREVASYLKDDYKAWDERFQVEMEAMAEFANDRLMFLEQLATATLGQRIDQLRRLDVLLGVEVRGGVL